MSAYNTPPFRVTMHITKENAYRELRRQIRKIETYSYRYSHTLLKTYGVTGPQIGLLKYLNQVPDEHMSLTKIANGLGAHITTVEGMVNRLKKSGFVVYLETNGTLAENFGKTIKYYDIIAMDIKLPSSTGNRPCWRQHGEFLRMAKKKDLIVKVVVGKKTSLRDFGKAARMVETADRRVPFIIQPDSRVKSALPLMNEVPKGLDDVRIIPQVHKIIGVP